MDYNATLQSNNAELQAILDEINDLPEATKEAVLYIAQSLTAAQQAQARENIGIAGTGADGLSIYTYAGDFIDGSTNTPPDGEGTYPNAWITTLGGRTLLVDDLVVDLAGNLMRVTAVYSESGAFDAEYVTNIMGPEGPQGDKGDKGDPGPAYTLTDTDKAAIAASVKASLTAETWTFELEDGTTTTKQVVVK